MKKKAWKMKIKKACIEAGTYKPFFDHVISTLAEICEKTDAARAEYEESEEGIVVEQTNKSGFTNLVKNPLFSIWMDLEKLALTYWTALGLTPAGLKKINEEALQADKGKKTANNLLQILEEKQKRKSI